MDPRQAKFGFRTSDGKERARTDAIFPIVSGKSVQELSVVGTGFYISSGGLLVSARHCFERADGSIESDQTFQAIHLTENNQFMLRPIVWGWHSSHADVSVCIAAEMTNNLDGTKLQNTSLTLTAERPPIGTEVCTYAFGKSKIAADGAKRVVSLYPHGYDGKLIRYYPSGRDRSSIPWPCYETSIEIHAGASGGPVFNLERGTVFAVNTSSLEGDESVSFVTPIDFILDAEFDNVKTDDGTILPRRVRELAEQGFIPFDPPLVLRG